MTRQYPTEPIFVGYLDGGNGTPAKGFKIPPPPADLVLGIKADQTLPAHKGRKPYKQSKA